MRLKWLSLLCGCLLLSSTSVFAHPHNWIDLKTEFELNDKGELISLQQYWQFDADFSEATIADIFHESRVQPDSLERLGDDMINNMQSFDYFSNLRLGAQVIPLHRPSDYELLIVEKEQFQHLYLRMKFTFNHAIAMNGKQLVWQVYDPTYYIDMKHIQKANISIRSNDKAQQCTVEVIQPKPSKRLTEFAGALDASMTDYNNDFSEQTADQSYVLDPLFGAPERLGEEFAETVLITCP